MRYLLGTNVLIRLVLVGDQNHLVTKVAIERLRDASHDLCITPQSIRETWHVLTRSSSANGAGLAPSTARAIVDEVLTDFILLDEMPAAFPVWLSIVSDNNITGAACHDANHAASAIVHEIDAVLTFDISDFKRFAGAGIRLVHPASA